MTRIPHLLWASESLVDGAVANQISVDPGAEHHADLAPQRMLALLPCRSPCDRRRVVM
jgi:quinolinate synthase